MANKTASAIHVKRQNQWSTILLMAIVGLILAVIFAGCLSQAGRLRRSRSLRDSLNTEILREQERAEEIEEYKEFTQTDAFIERIAREKLGLVYDGEVIFKEKQQ